MNNAVKGEGKKGKKKLWLSNHFYSSNLELYIHNRVTKQARIFDGHNKIK